MSKITTDGLTQNASRITVPIWQQWVSNSKGFG